MIQFRAIATGLASLVLVKSHISQGKNKIPFYKKQVMNKNAMVIFGLVRLITLVHSKLEAQNYWLPMHLIYVELEYTFDQIVLRAQIIEGT